MVSEGRGGFRCRRKILSNLTNQALAILRSGRIINRIYFSLAKRGEPETEDEINTENFPLEKELSETLPYDNNDLKTCRILNFRKARHVPAIAVTQQRIKKEAV